MTKLKFIGKEKSLILKMLKINKFKHTTGQNIVIIGSKELVKLNYFDNNYFFNLDFL